MKTSLFACESKVLQSFFQRSSIFVSENNENETVFPSLKNFAGNYRAVDNGSIKKHMAVHSSDKPIKCVYTSDVPY